MTRAHKVLDLLREAMPEYIEWHKVDPYKLMVLERMLKCWDHELGWDILFHAATEAVQTYAKRHEFYTGTIGVLQLVGSLMNLHPPMTSSRIRSYTRDRVMITVKDYQFGGKTTQTMKIDTFLDSLLMAIPPKSFQIVRRSGLFANTQKEYLDKAKEFLARDFSSEYRNVADPKTIVDAEQISYRKRQKKRTGTDPLVCECGNLTSSSLSAITYHILAQNISFN